MVYNYSNKNNSVLFKFKFIDSSPSLLSGLLNQDQFNFTYDDTSSEFPMRIKIKVHLFDTYLDISLDQVEGLVYNSSIYSKVLLHDLVLNTSQADLEDIVSDKKHFFEVNINLLYHLRNSIIILMDQAKHLEFLLKTQI